MGRILIDYPEQDSRLPSEPFEVRGRGESGVSCCSVVQIALAKDHDGSGCLWWKGGTRFVGRPCGSPLWTEAHDFFAAGTFDDGDEWTFELPALEPGSYQLRARNEAPPYEQTPVETRRFSVTP